MKNLNPSPLHFYRSGEERTLGTASKEREVLHFNDFLRAEIHFLSEEFDQGLVEQSGINDKGAETQRQTSQRVKHQMTSKSEHFSLLSTPPLNHARGWMMPPPQIDKFKHDTCEHDLIWKQGLCRCN